MKQYIKNALRDTLYLIGSLIIIYIVVSNIFGYSILSALSIPITFFLIYLFEKYPELFGRFGKKYKEYFKKQEISLEKVYDSSHKAEAVKKYIAKPSKGIPEFMILIALIVIFLFVLIIALNYQRGFRMADYIGYGIGILIGVFLLFVSLKDTIIIELYEKKDLLIKKYFIKKVKLFKLDDIKEINFKIMPTLFGLVSVKGRITTRNSKFSFRGNAFEPSEIEPLINSFKKFSVIKVTVS